MPCCKNAQTVSGFILEPDPGIIDFWTLVQHEDHLIGGHVMQREVSIKTARSRFGVS